MRRSAMRGDNFQKLLRISAAASVFLLGASALKAQATSQPSQPSSPPAPEPDVRTLADSVRELQGQVQSLAQQLAELRAEELRDHAEARDLRKELELARAQSSPLTGPAASRDSDIGLALQASGSVPTAAPGGGARSSARPVD